MRLSFAAVAAMLSLFSAIPAHAAEQASAEHMVAAVNDGEIAARRWCEACHLMDDQPRAGDPAGPLWTVATEATTTAEGLTKILGHNHGGLPDMQLPMTDLETLAVYLGSLQVH